MSVAPDLAGVPPGSVLSPLVLRHLGGKRYQLDADFLYLTRDGRLLLVPKGFITDGGSVPRLLWWWCPPFGTDADEAYVIHDAAYALAEEWDIDREWADRLMLEVLEVKGIRLTKRRGIFRGVRLGGWRAWGRHRNARRLQ